MRMKCILALDLGTTGIKAAACAKEGFWIAESYREIRQFYPRAGWVEHDPEEAFRAATQVISEVAEKVGPKNILCIGITNQRETTAVWHRKTGKPFSNMIVWQDTRTAKMCREMSELNGELREKTGLRINPYFSGSKLKWLAENNDEFATALREGNACFGTVDSWILYRLTGGKVHATDPSNASRTLLYDIKDMAFDKELLHLFSLEGLNVPEVLPSDSEFGFTDPGITDISIPVRAIIGDQQASLFSQAGHRKDIAKNTYGTGIFLLSGTGEKPVFSSSFLTSVAWQRGSETSYAVEGQAFMAGAALQWLRDNLKIIPDTPSTEKIAGALSDNEGVYFVPAFQGLASPYWDSSAKGMITGLTRKTSDSTIIRACLESLAYQTKDIIESMEKEFGSRHRKLKVDGGACANDFLMQFQADILGIEVERPVNIQTTALGAAGMAGCACGFWQDSEDFVKLNKTEKVFYPRMSAEDAAVLFNGYKKAVAACRSLS